MTAPEMVFQLNFKAVFLSVFNCFGNRAEFVLTVPHAPIPFDLKYLNSGILEKKLSIYVEGLGLPR